MYTNTNFLRTSSSLNPSDRNVLLCIIQQCDIQNQIQKKRRGKCAKRKTVADIVASLGPKTAHLHLGSVIVYDGGGGKDTEHTLQTTNEKLSMS